METGRFLFWRKKMKRSLKHAKHFFDQHDHRIPDLSAQEAVAKLKHCVTPDVLEFANGEQFKVKSNDGRTVVVVNDTAVTTYRRKKQKKVRARRGPRGSR